MVRFHGLIAAGLGLIGACLLALPVEAAQFQRWRFDQRRGTLEFTTVGGVQPRAQLISNPTRLVIDLPGTTLGRSKITESLRRNNFREIRIGQFNSQTTRIVIELKSGYTLDPNKVTFQPSSASQWVVQLPEPERISDRQPGRPNRPSAEPSGRPTPPNSVVGEAVSAATQLTDIRATPDGFFIRTTGKRPEVKSKRSRDRRLINIDLDNTAIAPNFTAADLPQGQLGVRLWKVTQLQATPPRLRITMEVSEDSPDWNVTTSSLGGVIVLPQGGVSALPPSRRPPVRTPPVASQPRPPASPSDGSIVIPVPPAPGPPPGQLPPPTIELPPLGSPLPRPDSRVTVVIDPGHGGRDPGAVGRGGLQEKRVIFPISLQVAALLEQQGVRAILTRRSDIEVDLEPRVQVAERADADLFVSIHANAISLSRPDVNGIETYYSSAEGRRLGSVLHNSLLQGTGSRDRGLRRARFYVIRRTSMPAVLLEVGFVTGAEDAPRLADPEFRGRLAEAIARGILVYIDQNF